MAGSTSKMLGQMGRQGCTQVAKLNPQCDDEATLDSPKLVIKPVPDMEHALTHMLGASFSDTYSPMD